LGVASWRIATGVVGSDATARLRNSPNAAACSATIALDGIDERLYIVQKLGTSAHRSSLRRFSASDRAH